jgi:ubiquinone/menaquinone biosynthesis C-methylase UbiE
MKIYNEKILPRFLDFSMSGRFFAKYRKRTLANVQGRVLEIGFGSGLNLPFYPATVEEIVTVDPNGGMNKLALKRISASPLKVQPHVMGGEALPFEEASFDSVVSTWTLCSIPQVEQALSEVYRVLKPSGKFYYVEHGLSNEPKIQKWQNRLNFSQKMFFGGCNTNRPIEQLLLDQNFKPLETKQFYARGSIKPLGYFYQGVMGKE